MKTKVIGIALVIGLISLMGIASIIGTETPAPSSMSGNDPSTGVPPSCTFSKDKDLESTTTDKKKGAAKAACEKELNDGITTEGTVCDTFCTQLADCDSQFTANPASAKCTETPVSKTQSPGFWELLKHICAKHPGGNCVDPPKTTTVIDHYEATGNVDTNCKCLDSPGRG